MTAPFFSVIVPVFNRAPLLRRVLDSVLQQSCQDFEIIVVDDGSTDDPRAVIEQIADPRIRFIRQNNQGGGVARNTGIDAAVGRFVAPLDSDDIFLPHHLQSMKALMDGTYDLVGYARVAVNRGDGRIFLKPPRAILPGEDMGEYLLCDRGFVPTITAVVERGMAARVRYHTKLRYAEDTDFAIRLALAGCSFQMLEKPGAVWNDLHDPARASSGGRAERFVVWLDEMKTQLSAKARAGARGWVLAKMLARDNRKLMALRFYLTALVQGCYRPSLAPIVALQIFLDAQRYRAMADFGVGWLRMGLRAPQKTSKRIETA